MKDARKSPRRKMDRQQITIPVSTDVQVIDISVGGVLFESAGPVAVGSRGTLRLNVGGLPFVVELQVLRVSPSGAGTGGSGYQVAGSFVNISTVHRRLIDRLMTA